MIKGIKIGVYEPVIEENDFFHSKVIKGFDEFKKLFDLIVANRMSDDTRGLKGTVHTRDLFNED